MAKVAKLMKNLTIVFGCGYKDPVIKKKKKKPCTYWVYQWCLSVYYKNAEKFKQVPFKNRCRNKTQSK